MSSRLPPTANPRFALNVLSAFPVIRRLALLSKLSLHHIMDPEAYSQMTGVTGTLPPHIPTEVQDEDNSTKDWTVDGPDIVHDIGGQVPRYLNPPWSLGAWNTGNQQPMISSFDDPTDEP